MAVFSNLFWENQEFHKYEIDRKKKRKTFQDNSPVRVTKINITSY